MTAPFIPACVSPGLPQPFRLPISNCPRSSIPAACWGSAAWAVQLVSPPTLPRICISQLPLLFCISVGVQTSPFRWGLGFSYRSDPASIVSRRLFSPVCVLFWGAAGLCLLSRLQWIFSVLPPRFALQRSLTSRRGRAYARTQGRRATCSTLRTARSSFLFLLAVAQYADRLGPDRRLP